MNLDINKESMDDNHSHSQDQSTVYSNSFNINTCIWRVSSILYFC